MERKVFKTRLQVFVVALLILGFTGCRGGFLGDENENLPPETYTVTQLINRTGDDRFVSQIDVQWWGDDPDGVVAGYEYSFDQGVWNFTQRQDSAFLVDLPEGADTFDFDFYIRAIDNLGLADPTPAHVVYPVKNSRPEINFDIPTGSPTSPGRWPVKTFSILQFKWKATDQDGTENIDYFEFFINDTTQPGVRIPSAFSSVTIEAENPESDLSDCRVLLGATLNEHKEKVSGLKLNQNNSFYIRAVDKVGAQSKIAGTSAIFVKKKVSNLLLVNAYNSSLSQREDFYTNNLNAIGITSFDTIRVNEVDGSLYTQLSSDNVTQSRIFAMYDVMIWFGEDDSYTLTLAQRTTGDFINKGGRMFASVFFSSSVDPLSTYLEFTPIDSLVEPTAGVFFMDNGAEAKPTKDGWPTLSSNRIITSARPFHTEFDGEGLYDASLKTSSGDWTGPATIMAKKAVNGKTKFIISSIELYRLNGNNNMPELFEKIFKEELELN